MEDNNSSIIVIDKVPVSRTLIEELSDHQLISPAATQYALRTLTPPRNWGPWTARLLSVLSVSLILAGIVHFFAFNWFNIPPYAKFCSIQLALVVCLAGSYYYGINKTLAARILLISAAVLTGVFFAVFGQVYQTGADSYTLFMWWSLIIFPWTLVANIAALWGVWLIVTNTFLILWWIQAALPDRHMEFILYTYLMFFNGLFLLIREYVSNEDSSWINERWIRPVLVLTILGFALFSSLYVLATHTIADQSIVVGIFLAGLMHVALFVTYRFRLPDQHSLAMTTLSACILIEMVTFRVLVKLLNDNWSTLYLLMGIMTVIVFTFATSMLRYQSRKMEGQ